MFSLQRFWTRVIQEATDESLNIPHDTTPLRDHLVAIYPLVRRTMLQGHEMILDLRVHEQDSAFRSGHYERPCVQRCLDLLPGGGVALDIGANIGFYACPLGAHLAHLGAGGRVYAFEPCSNNATRLQENIRLNRLSGLVQVERLALGTHPGQLALYREPQGAVNNAVGGNMFSAIDLENVQKEHWVRENVPMVRLDDWAAQHGVERCDLIKIDVEGAEMLVFEGARQLLARFRPAILGEFSPYWMKQIGQSFDDVIEFFEPLGYRFFRKVGGEFLPLTPGLVAQGLETPNYLLLPS